MPSSPSLQAYVYEELRRSMIVGGFRPGQLLKIRSLAAALDTSPTPVREALRRLVAEGALVGEPNRSIRVPLLTVERVHELRDLRVLVEGFAARRAAGRIDERTLDRLREIHLEVLAARDSGDVALDIIALRNFHMTLYKASRMPSLITIIESLFLQTGPLLHLLFPDYVKTRRGELRVRILHGLEARDGAAVEREIRDDITSSFDYIAERIASPPAEHEGVRPR